MLLIAGSGLSITISDSRGRNGAALLAQPDEGAVDPSTVMHPSDLRVCGAGGVHDPPSFEVFQDASPGLMLGGDDTQLCCDD